MVAYSFKARFASRILDGSKRQTIRNDRKRHARPGEVLQLYTGMRTRQCRLLGRAVCVAVAPIRLDFINDQVEIDGDHPIIARRLLDVFARQDGFDDWADLCRFWTDTHETPESFSGVLIIWDAIEAGSHG